MKVLYITTVLSTYESFLKPHVEKLISMGHEVELGCSLNISDNVNDHQIVVHSIPFSRSMLNNKFFNIKRTIIQLIKSRQYDVVHVHTPIASAITRLVIPFNRNFRLFYTSHGFHFHPNSPCVNWVYFVVEWLLSFKTDKLITINNWDYQIAKKYFNHAEVVKCNGVGLNPRQNTSKSPIRSELNINDSDFILINVAEHNKNKNQKLLLKIVKDLRNPHLHLILVGKGRLSDYYRKYTESHSLQSNVHILGYRKDVFELLNQSNLFVFPSKREGLGMALIEALSIGKPFIAYDIRGVVDICQNHYQNYLIRPYSANLFKEKITDEYNRFLNSPLNYNEDYTNLNLERYSMQNALEFISSLYEQ